MSLPCPKPLLVSLLFNVQRTVLPVPMAPKSIVGLLTAPPPPPHGNVSLVPAIPPSKLSFDVNLEPSEVCEAMLSWLE